MKKLFPGALAALLFLTCLSQALAADVKPVINDAGKLRPVHSGETVGVANGGTGATTQGAAANAVLPSQTGNSGKYLTTDGSNASWGTVSAGASITVKDEGSTLTSALTSIDCVGAGVACTNSSGAVTLTVSGGGGGTTDITPPQGRLTLTSNTPVMTADATAQSTVYYAPYVGKYLPIYGGSSWSMLGFAQTSLALNSTDNLAGTLYDVFGYSNAGTLTLGTGPAWSNAATITVTIASPAVVSWTAHGLKEGDPVVFTTSGALPTGITAGTTYYVTASPSTNSFNISTSVANAAAGTKVNTSGSQSGTHTATNGTTTRGNGAGTTELELKDGVWTNKNSITLRAGGSSLGSISANQATYLGTVYMTANGQTGMAFAPAGAAGGSAPVLGVWNAYNRVMTRALSRDSTSSWTNNSSVWRASNASVSNRVTFVVGLAISPVASTLVQGAFAGANGLTFGSTLDSTTATPKVISAIWSATGTTTTRENFNPGVGLHYLQGMESSPAGAGGYTVYGTQAYGSLNNLILEVDL